MSFDTISVVGLGYIGLPTAAMFASQKKNVIGVDVNQHAVDTINRGEIHIVEPGLYSIVNTAVNEGFLRAVTIPEAADAFLIAVPTPFKDSYNSVPEPDLTYIESASKSIASVLKKGDLVILESTSPVGATELMSEWLAKERPDLRFPAFCSGTNCEPIDVNIAYCPERVLPGNVVKELIDNDRVIGGMTSECSRRAIELYKTFVQGECVVTNARTAEMSKLTENSCRDVQIAFANELSIICDDLGIDVWELISLANRHPRVDILQPGPGVGGHCIAVDPWFIVSKNPDLSRIIKCAREINDFKPAWVIEKIRKEFTDLLLRHPAKSAQELHLVFYGITFKPNIDDLRESPALEILKGVRSTLPCKISVVEPNIKALPSGICADSLITLEKGLETSDLNILLVAHDEFRVSALENADKLSFVKF